jgi:hypothetical protein
MNTCEISVSHSGDWCSVVFSVVSTNVMEEPAPSIFMVKNGVGNLFLQIISDTKLFEITSEILIC